MLGSSNSIACANMMLNSAVAESLKQFADELEGKEDFDSAMHELIKKTIKEHKRIIFNGNGYDDAWIEEAVGKRGLLNYRTTPDCMPHLLDRKNVDMLTYHKVFSEAELESRCEIMLENYNKTVAIEANTMIDMTKKQLLPAIEEYTAKIASAAKVKMDVVEGLSCSYEKKIISRLSGLIAQISDSCDELESAVVQLQSYDDVKEASYFIRDEIIAKMARLRLAADEAETLTDAKCWPYPSYADLLFGVR